MIPVRKPKSIIWLTCFILGVYVIVGPIYHVVRTVINVSETAVIKTKITNTSSKSSAKVLIIAHMRGGSTFLSELFNMNDDACYWCEPVEPMFHAMYGCSDLIMPADVHFTPTGQRKKLTTYERRHLAFYILQLLSETEAQNILPEILYSGAVLKKGSRWTKMFEWCVEKNRRDLSECTDLSCETMAECHPDNGQTQTDLNHLLSLNSSHCPTEKVKCHYDRMLNLQVKTENCLKHVDESCFKKSIKAIKSIRLPLDIAEDILVKDQSVKIIYNIRDPRGIYISRRNGPWWVDSKVSNGNRLLDMKYVCKLMDEDYETLQRLQKEFPNNILFMKYEDFAKDPEEWANLVYKYIGRTLHRSVKSWLNVSTHARKDDGYVNTMRINSTKTAYAWREKIKLSDFKTINGYCKQTLKAFGYPEYL